MTAAPGVLYVVATPIGNLEDFTFRGLRTLQEVDLIAAEDTRRTAKLLAHYHISKPLVSLREHNEARESVRLVRALSGGRSVALVSDAGTPAIADPGARLVRSAREAGVRVVPIPGPSAITAALSISGLSSTPFVFVGYPPAAGAARRGFFEQVAREDRTVVLFEAPHRLHRTLRELAQYMGKQQILIHSELSKINENLVELQINDLPQAKGEFTVVVHSASEQTPSTSKDDVLTDRIGQIANIDGFTPDERVKIVAALAGISEQKARRALKKYMFSVKRQMSSST